MATTLVKGDIAIIQFNSDAPSGANLEGDGFTFVLLADVDATTTINFTDAGFNTAGQIVNDTAVFEGTRTWTSGQALSAGTVVRIYDGVPNDASHGHQTASVGTVTSTGPNSGLASSGDQIFVYQGPVASTGDTPNLLFGLNFGDDAAANPLLANGWNTNAPAHNGTTWDNNESQLPASLVGYEVGFTPEIDNGYYTGPTSGTPASVLAAIMDESNWVVSNSSPATNPPQSYSNFTVAAPSAAPSLDTNIASSLAEGGLDVITSSELETNDTDTADASLTYTVTTTAVANGTLFIDADGSGTVNAGDTTLGLGATFTQADIAAGRVKYLHNGSETTSDSFGFMVSDGPNQITGQTFNFTVTPVSDAPVITNVNGDTISYFEGFTTTNVDLTADATVSDIDNANFNGGSLTVSFSAGGQSEDDLTVANTGFAAGQTGLLGANVFASGVQIGSFTGGTGGTNLVVSLNANATPALTQVLIRNILYQNQGGDNPNTTQRTVDIVLNDGATNSSTQQVTINITASNDNPSGSGVPSDITVTQDTASDVDLSAVTLTDPDSASVTVTLSVSAGTFGTPADGAGVGGGVIETLVNATTITLAGSLADVQSYLDTASNIQYTGASGVSGDDAATLTVTVNDGDGSGNVAVGTANIDITALNQPAVAQDDAFSVGATGTLTSSNVFADNGNGVDSDNEADPFVVTEVNGNAVNVGSQITLASGALLTLNGNGTFSYDPNGQFTDLGGPLSGAANATGTDSFTYTITGGDTATATITVNGVDDIDVLTGTAGNDSLWGGAQNDTLNGGLGADTLEGGAGSDVHNGDGGTDLVSYARSNAGVNISLQSGYVNGTDAAGDTFNSIEGIIGTNHDDRLSGDGNANELRGEMGNDILRGRGGADVLNGGTGSDTADYEDSASFVSVNLGTGATSGGGASNDADGDTFTSIENLTGSRWNDILTGDGNANVLQGRLGSDALDGAGGSDTASYEGSGAFVNVSLGTGFAGGGSRSHAIGDTFSNIENLAGSAHGDRLAGDANANTLQGNAGNDILRGRGGADVLEGGAGSDTADYEDSATFVSVNLGTGATSGGGASNDADGDTFSSIENLTGSRWNDVLTGDGNANTLQGRLGADALDGGAGSDTASYEGSVAFVNVSLGTGFAGGGSRSHAIGDTFTSIENLIGSTHNDILAGDANANTINGMAGNDMLRGWGGADVFVFDSGFGNDTIADYTDGVDKLNFRDTAFGSLTIGTSGADATVDDGNGSVLTILNAAGMIEASDFL